MLDLVQCETEIKTAVQGFLQELMNGLSMSSRRARSAYSSVFGLKEAVF